MNEFNTYEFVVNRKKEGKYKLSLFLGRAAVILVFVIIAVVLCVCNMPMLVAIEFPLIPVGIYVAKLFTQEYEYSMTSGIMTFSLIRGSSKRKKLLELMIKDFREIAPYDNRACGHLENIGIKKDYQLFSSPDAPDVYYGLFEKDGEMQVVYFEATQQALKILRFYNPATVVTNVSR
ncbi:MAG: hypothetical protein MJ192_02480 [Clostridia bacterium]|nr:hypothetical protein [Clostridia bacterium]